VSYKKKKKTMKKNNKNKNKLRTRRKRTTTAAAAARSIEFIDVWLTMHRNSVWIRKNQLDVTFVFFISLLLVAQHVSGNNVPIIRS